MTNIQKCGVIGVGFVGATCAYTLAVSGLFSDLVLVDMNRDKLSVKLRTSIMVWRSASRAASWPETMLTSPNAVLSSCGRRKPEARRKPFGAARTK